MGNGNTIGIIGCGNMGGAVAEAVVRSGIVAPERLYLNDSMPDRARDTALRTGGSAVDLDDLSEKSHMVVLAVKPSDFDSLADRLKNSRVRRFLSVMAGRTMEDITARLGESAQVARVMPNMGASVRKSVSVVSFSPKFDEIRAVTDILSAMGEVLTVEERLIDGATAVSGSGPAYFFYFAQCLVQAAINEGFSESQARTLVLGTFAGSAEILGSSRIGIDELIAKVSSKGGTTEAALEVFRQTDLEDMTARAVSAASRRAQELSGGQ